MKQSRYRSCHSLSPMQSGSLPILYSSFKAHRDGYQLGAESLSLSLNTTQIPPNRAYLPSPPMSGSPSPKDSSPDLSRTIGQRRKRSESPPSNVAVVAATALVVPPVRVPSPFIPSTRSLVPPVPIQVSRSPYSTSQQPSYGTSLPTTESVSEPDESQRLPRSISPKGSRKNKAHVASACVNCKKKHLRCDAARPCRRCVQNGKEVSRPNSQRAEPT